MSLKGTGDKMSTVDLARLREMQDANLDGEVVKDSGSSTTPVDSSEGVSDTKALQSKNVGERTEIKREKSALDSTAGVGTKKALTNTKVGFADAIDRALEVEPRPLDELADRPGILTSIGQGIWKSLQRVTGTHAVSQAETHIPGRLGATRFTAQVMGNFKNPVQFFEKVHGELGESVEVKFPTGHKFLLDASPDVLRATLMNTDKKTDLRAGDVSNFEKPPLQGRGLAYLVGSKNVFMGAGQAWAEVHPTIAPTLSPRRVHSEDFLKVMEEAVEESIDDIHAKLKASDSGEVNLDIGASMQRVTLDVLLRTLFSKRVSGDEMTRLQDAFKTVMTWLSTETMNPTNVSVSRLSALLPKSKELREAYKTLHGFAEDMISDRRDSGEPGDDALGALLEGTNALTGEPFSDERIRNEVLTLVLAGHETTATMLSWAFGLLARDPERQAKLRDEVDTALGGKRPTVDNLRKDMDLTNGVVQETLRLYSPAYFLVRRATQNVAVPTDGGGEKNIAKGTIVVMSAFHAHRSGDYWEQGGLPADEWHPERWLEDEDSGFKASAGKMFPFGGGSRKCLGAAMSQFEAKLLLARFAQEFELSADHEMGMASDISVHPADSTVTVKARSGDTK